MADDMRANPYLSGNFAPVGTEDDFELPVTGELPQGLEGTLYRIGPNPRFEPRDPNYHWFTGDGMVHAFRIAAGKASYRNRWARTPKWELEDQHGRSLFAGFNPMLSDPLAQGRDGGVANTNILSHAGRLLALEEAHAPFEMAGDLASVGYADDYGGRVTAHPKIDPATGEMVWFAYGVGEAPLSAGMSYGVTGPDGRVVRRQDFEAPFAAMVHDFMVTESHVLFPVLPLTASLERAMTGKPAFAWEPDKGAFVGVMRRDADVSTIRWIEVPAGYVFHPMNAWDEDGRIVAEVFRYDAAPLFPNADGSPGARTAAQLHRWTFDLATGQSRQEQLDDLDGEFPRFDERWTGRKHRYGWFAADSTGAKSVKLNAIAHLDRQTGRRNVLDFGPDLVSEPVFVPASDEAAEGEGWVLAVVWRAAENRSDLVVLDAQDIAAGPVATAHVPRRVPFGFHGNWVGD